ncbi:MAG: hypothetical protein AAGA48_20305 [Myxococcota bacterium]
MFGIDWAILLGLGGFVGTIVIGAPFTRALAEPAAWRSRDRKDRGPSRDRPSVTVGFTPLDLGEDPMSWPSERPWPPGLKSPPWPSQTWDDEHFGSFWRGENAPPADTAEPAPPRRASPPRVRRTREATPPRKLRRATTRPEDSPPEPVAHRAPSPSPRTSEPPALPAVTPPPRVELEQLIATIGLAGTVQSIMQRTGWDFRKAAHYLARIRQDD